MLFSVSQEGAVLLVGVVAVAAVGWGAVLSVRSALRGPRWALGHVRAVRRLLPLVLVAGSATVVLVRPVWAGFALVYVGALVWWLSGALRRSLERVEASGGFFEIPAESRRRIVRRARGLLAAGGILLLAGAGFAFEAGVTAVVTGVLGIVLLATAGILGREGSGP